jgi:hypothetical protein
VALQLGGEISSPTALCNCSARALSRQYFHWTGLSTDFKTKEKEFSIFTFCRVFMLLTYLGRKSLLSSTKSTVLESVLQALGKLLKPIFETKGYKKAQLDLSLIGWLLLFLSSCLDVCLPDDKSEQGL